MRNKVIKNTLAILLIAFVGYHSVYFKKLDEVATASSTGGFNAGTFARNFFDNELLQRVDSAANLNVLISQLKTRPQEAFTKYSHALAIGNLRYFLVQGEGTIRSTSDDAIVVDLKGSAEQTDVIIATEFIYGNAIRDASGLLNLNDFSNTAEFNSISENINDIVRSEVVPPFRGVAKPGSEIRFAGAIEMNQKYVDLKSIEVVPIRLSIQP